MAEFSFSPDHHEAEIEKVKQRFLTKERLFVLLLGPSAVGKSTLIQELNELSDGITFDYVKPYMTRPNRPNETDKVSVSDSEFDRLERSGQFVVVNPLYEVRYGTPLKGILTPLEQGNIPILDYPLAAVPKLHRPEYDTLNFYIYPRSTDQLRQRLESSGRDQGGRLESGLQELGQLAENNLLHPDIDVSIVNDDGAANSAASIMLHAIEEVTR